MSSRSPTTPLKRPPTTPTSIKINSTPVFSFYRILTSLRLAVLLVVGYLLCNWLDGVKVRFFFFRLSRGGGCLFILLNEGEEEEVGLRSDS